MRGAAGPGEHPHRVAGGGAGARERGCGGGGHHSLVAMTIVYDPCIVSWGDQSPCASPSWGRGAVGRPRCPPCSPAISSCSADRCWPSTPISTNTSARHWACSMRSEEHTSELQS